MFLAYLTGAAIVTFPLILQLGRAVPDPVDGVFNTWVLAWQHFTLLNQPRDLLNANIFFPYPDTLLFSETLLIPALLLMPLEVAGLGALAVHNVAVFLGFASTGLGGYLLGRWQFRNRWSGLALGGILAFNGYTLSNVGQMQLLHLAWLPLALLYMGKLLRRPHWRSAAFMAGFIAAQFYTVIYYGVFSFVVVGLVGGAVWLISEYASLGERVRALFWFLGALLLGILLCLPLGLRYFQLSELYGFARTNAESWPFSASLEMWLAAPPNHRLYGEFFGVTLPTLGYYLVDSLFPGLMLLSMSALGIAMWFRRAWRGDGRRGHRRAWWPLAMVVGVCFFFVLSLGPYPQVVTLEPNFAITLPYAYLHEWVPGFGALRAPGRFAIIVYLALGVLVAYFFARIKHSLVRATVMALLAVEVFAFVPPPLFAPTPNADGASAYAWLATQPRSTYVELPIYPFGEAGSEALWLDSQLRSVEHWHSSPIGYSGFFPPRYREMVALISQFPRAESVRFLSMMPIEWLILHGDRYDAAAWTEIEAAVAHAGWETHQWDDVWVVRLPAQEAAQPNVSFFMPDVAQRDGEVGVGMILTSTSPTAILPDSKLGRLRFEWWTGEQRARVDEIVAQPPMVIDGVAVATILVPSPEVAGVYELKVFRTMGDAWVGVVNVVEDVGRPERELVAVKGLRADIRCVGEDISLTLLMQTVGWYDRPFTLSALMLDGQDVEVARAAADVEFAPEPGRAALLNVAEYVLPLDALPEKVPRDDEGAWQSVDLYAYTWQDSAQRTVERRFVADDGQVLDRLRLPLQIDAGCHGG